MPVDRIKSKSEGLGDGYDTAAAPYVLAEGIQIRRCLAIRCRVLGIGIGICRAKHKTCILLGHSDLVIGVAEIAVIPAGGSPECGVGLARITLMADMGLKIEAAVAQGYRRRQVDVVSTPAVVDAKGGRADRAGIFERQPFVANRGIGLGGIRVVKGTAKVVVGARILVAD